MGSIRIEAPQGFRLRQQEILAELGAYALRIGGADALLHEAARLVAQGLQTEFCAVLQWQPAGERLLPRAVVGWPDRVSLPSSIDARSAASASEAIRTGEPVISNIFPGRGRFPLSPLLRGHGLRRAIDVVIRRGGTVFGVLEGGTAAPGDVGPADVAFMQAAANLLGVALARARTEIALATSRTRTSEILESISDIFCALDHEFRFTHVNRRAEEWGARPRGELIGNVIWEVFPQLVGSEVQAAYQRAAREQRIVHLEALAVLRPRWVEIDIHPNDRGLAIYFRDIDERKRAEVALRESEARLRFATESAGIGTWEQDIASGRILRSARHAAIFGVDLSVEWSHAAFLRHVVPEDRATADHIREEALAASGEWCIECRILRANDGALRWVEARGAPMPEPSGEIRRYVGIISDVTERKEAEAMRARLADELEQRVAERTWALAGVNTRLLREIAERQRAERALMQAQRLEAIGQLVGGVAHSFNNLLAVVIGNLELMRLEGVDDRARKQRDRAMRAAWRGSMLTHQLLAYAGQQPLEPRPVDPNAVLAGMQELLQQIVGEAVQIETDLAPLVWPAVGDPAQLKSIVVNLARNAHDAMPAGGRLWIATRNVGFDEPDLPAELPSGDYILLSVADAGTGMPPEVLARACEPFFTTKPIGQGDGLGLAQVDGVVRQFGGALRLHSVPGEGTTVEVYLPRAQERTPAGADDRAAALPMGVVVVPE